MKLAVLAVCVVLCLVSGAVGDHTVRVNRIFAAAGDYIQIDALDTSNAVITAIASVDLVDFQTFPKLSLNLPSLNLAGSSVLVSGSNSVTIDAATNVDLQAGNKININGDFINYQSTSGDVNLRTQIFSATSGYGLNLDSLRFFATGSEILLTSEGGDVDVVGTNSFTGSGAGYFQMEADTLASASSKSNVVIQSTSSGGGFEAAGNDQVLVNAATSFTTAATFLNTFAGGGVQYSGNDISFAASQKLSLSSTTDSVDIISHGPRNGNVNSLKITTPGAVNVNADREGVFIQSRGPGDTVFNGANGISLTAQGAGGEGDAIQVKGYSNNVVATGTNSDIVIKADQAFFGGIPGNGVDFQGRGSTAVGLTGQERFFVQTNNAEFRSNSSGVLNIFTKSDALVLFQATTQTTSDFTQGVLTVSGGMDVRGSDVRVDGGGTVTLKTSNNLQMDGTASSSILAYGGMGNTKILLSGVNGAKATSAQAIDASGGVFFFWAKQNNVDITSGAALLMQANNNADSRVTVEAGRDFNVLGQTFVQTAYAVVGSFTGNTRWSAGNQFLSTTLNTQHFDGGAQLNVNAGDSIISRSVGAYQIKSINCGNTAECATQGYGSVLFSGGTGVTVDGGNQNIYIRDEGDSKFIAGQTLTLQGKSQLHIRTDPLAYDSNLFSQGRDGYTTVYGSNNLKIDVATTTLWTSQAGLWLTSQGGKDISLSARNTLRVSSDNSRNFDILAGDAISSRSSSQSTLINAGKAQFSAGSLFDAHGNTFTINTDELGSHFLSKGGQAITASTAITIEGDQLVDFRSFANINVNAATDVRGNAKDYIKFISQKNNVNYYAGTFFTASSGGSIHTNSGQHDGDQIGFRSGGTMHFSGATNLDLGVELGPLNLDSGSRDTTISSLLGKVSITGGDLVDFQGTILSIVSTKSNTFNGGDVSIFSGSGQNFDVGSAGDISVVSKQISLASEQLFHKNDSIVFSSGFNLLITGTNGPVTIQGNQFQINAFVNQSLSGFIDLSASGTVTLATSASFDINIYGGGDVNLISHGKAGIVGHYWSSAADLELWGAQAVSIRPHSLTDGYFKAHSVYDMYLDSNQDAILINDGQGINFKAYAACSNGVDIVTVGRHDVVGFVPNGVLRMESTGHTDRREAEFGDTNGLGVDGHDPQIQNSRLYEVGFNIRTTDPLGNIVVESWQAQQKFIAQQGSITEESVGLVTVVGAYGVYSQNPGITNEAYIASEDGFVNWRGNKGVAFTAKDSQFLESSRKSYLDAEDRITLQGDNVALSAAGGHLTMTTHSFGTSSSIVLEALTNVQLVGEGTGLDLSAAYRTLVTAKTGNILFSGAAGVVMSTLDGPISIHAGNRGTIAADANVVFDAGLDLDFIATRDIAFHAGTRLSVIATGHDTGDDINMLSKGTFDIISSKGITFESDGSETGSTEKDRVALSSGGNMFFRAQRHVSIEAHQNVIVGAEEKGPVIKLIAGGDTSQSGIVWRSDGDINMNLAGRLDVTAGDSIDIHTLGNQVWTSNGPITLIASAGVELDSNKGSSVFTTQGGNINMLSDNKISILSKSLLQFKTVNHGILIATQFATGTNVDIKATAPAINIDYGGRVGVAAQKTVLVEGLKNVLFQTKQEKGGNIVVNTPLGTAGVQVYQAQSAIDIISNSGAPYDIRLTTIADNSPITVQTRNTDSNVIFDSNDRLQATANMNLYFKSSGGISINTIIKDVTLSSELALSAFAQRNATFIGDSALSVTATQGTLTASAANEVTITSYDLMTFQYSGFLDISAPGTTTLSTTPNQQGSISFQTTTGNVYFSGGQNFEINAGTWISRSAGTSIVYYATGSREYDDGKNGAIRLRTTADYADIVVNTVGKEEFNAQANVLFYAGGDGNSRDVSFTAATDLLATAQTGAINLFALSDSITDTAPVQFNGKNIVVGSLAPQTTDISFVSNSNELEPADSGAIQILAPGVTTFNGENVILDASWGANVRFDARNALTVSGTNGVVVSANSRGSNGNGILLEVRNPAQANVGITLSSSRGYKALANGDISFHSAGLLNAGTINFKNNRPMKIYSFDPLNTGSAVQFLQSGYGKVIVQTTGAANIAVSAGDAATFEARRYIHFTAGADITATSKTASFDVKTGSFSATGANVLLKTANGCGTKCFSTQVGTVTFAGQGQTVYTSTGPNTLNFKVPGGTTPFVRQVSGADTFFQTSSNINGATVNDFDTFLMNGANQVSINSDGVQLISRNQNINIYSGYNGIQKSGIYVKNSGVVSFTATTNARVQAENDVLFRGQAVGVTSGGPTNLQAIRGSIQLRAGPGPTETVFIQADGAITITSPKQLRHREHTRLGFFQATTASPPPATTNKFGIFFTDGAFVPLDCWVTSFSMPSLTAAYSISISSSNANSRAGVMDTPSVGPPATLGIFANQNLGTRDRMVWGTGCPNASQRIEQIRQALYCYGLLLQGNNAYGSFQPGQVAIGP